MQGEAILDHAWRTPGVRELVAIPLYLTALLAHIPSGTFPTTKEELLRLFVTEHERAPDKAEALREAVFGFHTEMLTALAVEATRAANTTITDSRARAVVKGVEEHLSFDGQITIAPQPTTVLDVLVSYHMLVRSGAETGGISFQHQQFQEWYASFDVEALMRAAAAGNTETKHRLKADVLNMRAWEEPILFACERVSRSDGTGLHAIAVSILETMGIDPMLAAEMIFRSSSGVWDEIKEKIIAFVGSWHVSGKVDRGVHFMISTGRSEFASQIWPLISDADIQVHLPALRAGRQFRSSVLGADVEARIAQLSERLREHIVAEIARLSGMDGIQLAVRLAQVDASPKMQASVIETLLFRRADRFALQILRAAPDKVWRMVALKGYAEEIGDSAAAARLRHERQRYVEEETQPLKKLQMLIDAARHGAALGPQVGRVIEDPDFPVKEQDASWVIERAYKCYPTDVATALLHRLEAGREIPFGAERMLQGAGFVVDKGPIVDRVMQSHGYEKIAETAASIVGPETVGKLIDRLIALNEKLRSSQGRVDEATSEEYREFERWVSRTRLTSFIKSMLSRSATTEPGEIALLADLIARHGNGEQAGPLQLDRELYDQMIAVVGRWAEILLTSSAANRPQLAHVAQAIGRLAASELVPTLERLLSQDLARWRRAREAYTAAHARGAHIDPDAYTSWTLWYRRAFASIGNDQVVELMKTYLPDKDFGVEAGYVLKAIWERQHDSPKDNRLQFWPNFSEVKARRMEHQGQGTGRESSVLAEAIVAVVNDLVRPDAGDNAHRHALQLAKIAFSMPYGNKTEVIDSLLQLPRPLAEKQGLLTVLVLAGEVIRADMVLDGIKTLLEEAKTKQWLLDLNRGELEAWLDLLPFSDRPVATLDALELLEPNLRQPWRLRRLLSALGHALSPEAEHVLDLLPQKDARFLSEHDWLAAFDKRGTVSAARMLLELICEGAFAGAKGGLDTWTLSQKLASVMRAHPDFRTEICQRHERLPTSPGKAILEHAIAEDPDADSVLILVRSYAQEGKPFDNLLRFAIENVALGKHESKFRAGVVFKAFSVPIPDLRKRLFAMTNGDTSEGRLATACLTVIDEFRDDYGPAESEPRHPDIDSGRPWPLAAGQQ